MEKGKNKLYITISDSRKGDESTPTQQPEGTQDSESSKTGGMGALGRYAEHQLFHIVRQNVTQFANYALSNIGDLTGDYIAQRKVNVAKQAISGIVSVGESTLGGFAVGGIIGAVAGFAFGALSLIGSSIYSDMENRKNNRILNMEIGQLRDRAGLNTVYDGSRGTEN